MWFSFAFDLGLGLVCGLGSLFLLGLCLTALQRCVLKLQFTVELLWVTYL